MPTSDRSSATPTPTLVSIRRADAAQLWADWLALWNGDLARAERIIAPDYVLHMTPIGGGDLARFAGPAGLAAWIGQLRAVFQPMRFTVQVAPLFDRDLIAGRWTVDGVYRGGFPGATAAPGTAVHFAGADFLRVADGKIVEYWLSADIPDLMAQLEMVG